MSTLKPREVAARLGIHPDTLRRYARQGRIKSKKLSSRLRVYDEEAVRQFEEQAERNSASEEGKSVDAH